VRDQLFVHASDHERRGPAAIASLVTRAPRAARPSSTVSGTTFTVDDRVLDDVRAVDPVERLLEDSWDSRSQRATAREIVVETVATALFFAVAVPLAAGALAAGRLPLSLTVLLVGLYAAVRTTKFPIGAGYVVPSYLVLVPMLLLLPPSTVPLSTAAGLLAGSGVRLAAGRGKRQGLLFAVPDAWHALVRKPKQSC
jgi:hypothetical protein